MTTRRMLSAGDCQPLRKSPRIAALHASQLDKKDDPASPVIQADPSPNPNPNPNPEHVQSIGLLDMPYVPMSVIFDYLRTDERCTDLSNFRKASSVIGRQVDMYVNIPSNSLNFHTAKFIKNTIGPGYKVVLRAYPENVCMQSLNLLGTRLSKKGMIIRNGDELEEFEMELRNEKDGAIDYLAELIGSRIKRLYISQVREDKDMSILLTVINQLKKIESLFLTRCYIQGSIPSSILSIVRRCEIGRVDYILGMTMMNDSSSTEFLKGWVRELDNLTTDLFMEKFRCTRNVTHGHILDLDKKFWRDFISEKMQQRYRYVDVNGIRLSRHHVNPAITTVESIHLRR